LVAGAPFLTTCQARKFSKIETDAAPATTADRKLLEPNGNWQSVYQSRERDYLSYFNPTTEKEKTAVNWFSEMPLGIQGLPWLVLKVAIQQYPHIWGKGLKGVGDTLGGVPSPSDYHPVQGKTATESWVTKLKDETERKGLPYGFVSHPDLSGDPATIPNARTTFFSCASCHTSRILTKVKGADGKEIPAIRYYVGGVNTEIEAQKFAGLLYETTKELTNVGDEKVRLPSQVKPKVVPLIKFAWALATYDCRLYKPDLGEDGVRECRYEKDNILGQGFAQKLRSIVWNKNDEEYAEQLINSSAEAKIIRDGQLEVFDDLGGQVENPLCEIKPVKASTPHIFKLVKSLIGTGFKVKIQMMQLGLGLPYRPAGVAAGRTQDDKLPSSLVSLFNAQEKKVPPHIWDNRPGQMDAFGLVQGVGFLNALRPDGLMFKNMSPEAMDALKQTYGGDVSAEDRALANLWATQEKIKMDPKQGGTPCLQGTWAQNVSNWFTQASALSDIKSLYRSEDETHANWDGNQGAGARVLASGLSSVGDPLKVFTEIHETQNKFIDKLPAPPYPFDDLNSAEAYSSALKGQQIFLDNKSCGQCHVPKNRKIYDTGTDLNRAIAVWAPATRFALITLTSAACKAGKKRLEKGIKWGVEPASQIGADNLYWCEKVDGVTLNSAEDYLNDVYRPIRGVQDLSQKPGYKADPLYGIWADAPYLHNGSVPTLRELLMDKNGRLKALADRGNPGKFVRGNIRYDQANVGFMATASNPKDYVNGDTIRNGNFDVTLRGNDNGGHEFFHHVIEEDDAGNWVGKTGTEFSEADIENLLTYLKTR
jgi:hypothetical protein